MRCEVCPNTGFDKKEKSIIILNSFIFRDFKYDSSEQECVFCILLTMFNYSPIAQTNGIIGIFACFKNNCSQQNDVIPEYYSFINF